MIKVKQAYNCYKDLVPLMHCGIESSTGMFVNHLPGIKTASLATLGDAEFTKVKDIDKKVTELSILQLATNVYGMLHNQNALKVDIVDEYFDYGDIGSEVFDYRETQTGLRITKSSTNRYKSTVIKTLSFYSNETKGATIFIEDISGTFEKTIKVKCGYNEIDLNYICEANQVELYINNIDCFELGTAACTSGYCRVCECSCYTCLDGCHVNSIRKNELGHWISDSTVTGLCVGVTCELDYTKLICGLAQYLVEPFMYKKGINYMQEILNNSYASMALTNKKDDAEANILQWNGGFNPDTEIRVKGLYWKSLDSSLSSIINFVTAAAGDSLNCDGVTIVTAQIN